MNVVQPCHNRTTRSASMLTWETEKTHEPSGSRPTAGEPSTEGPDGNTRCERHLITDKRHPWYSHSANIDGEDTRLH